MNFNMNMNTHKIRSHCNLQWLSMKDGLRKHQLRPELWFEMSFASRQVQTKHLRILITSTAKTIQRDMIRKDIMETSVTVRISRWYLHITGSEWKYMTVYSLVLNSECYWCFVVCVVLTRGRMCGKTTLHHRHRGRRRTSPAATPWT